MAGEPPIDQEDDTRESYLDQILRRLNSDQEASASPSSTSGDMASSIPHPSLNPMTSSTIPWQHTSPSDTSSSHGNPGSQNSQQLYRPPIPSNYRDPLAEFPWLMDELDQQRGTQIPVTTSRTAPTRPSIHSGQSYTSRFVDVPYNHERRLEQLEGGSGSSGRKLLTSEGGMGRTILHRPNPSRRGGVQWESNQGEGTSSRAPPLRRQLSQSVQRDRSLERSYNTSHVGPPVRTRSVPLSQRNPGAIGESHEVAQMRWPQSASTGQTYLESTQTELHSAIPSSGAGSRAPPSPLLLPGGSMNSETPNSGSISSEPMSDGDDEEEKKDSGASKQEVRRTGGEGASSGKRKTPEPSTEDGDESAKSESEALKKPAMNRPRKRGGAKRLREPRYAIKTRTEVDIMDDGFKWRKYGQKAVKNSPHPRNYYRCTTPQCPVRKRVERSCEDSGLVITTYEGTHTHQTPGFHRSAPGGYFEERGLHGGLYLPGQNPLGTFGIGSSNLLQYPGRFNLASLQQAALRGQLGSQVNSNLGILGQSDQAALRLQEAGLQHQQESLLRAQHFLGLQDSFQTGQVKQEPFQYGGQEFLPRGAPPFNPRQFQRPSGSSQGGEGSHGRELLDRGLMRDGSQGPFSGLDYRNLPQQMTNEMTHLRSSLGRGRGHQEQVGPDRGSQEPFTGVPRVRHQDLARAMMYSSEGSERRVEEGTLHPRRGVVPAAVEDLQGGSSGSEMDITDAAGLLQDIVRPGGPVLSRPL